MEKDKESKLEALRQGRLAAYKVFAGGGNRTAYREVCKRAQGNTSDTESVVASESSRDTGGGRS